MEYFEAIQRFHGGWGSLHFQPTTAELIAYTSQVLTSIYECLQSTSQREEAVRKGVVALRDTHHPNPLFHNLLRIKGLHVWPEYVDTSQLANETLYLLERKLGEFGGRENRASFELAFSIEVLLECNLWQEMSQTARRRYQRLLLFYLNQKPDYLADVSHYSWMIDLAIRLEISPPKWWLESLASTLTKWPREKDFWLRKREWDRPKDTPDLVCDEFITAHIILSVSRILRHILNDRLYSLISPAVHRLAIDFNPHDLWIAHSRITGIRRADPYMTALIIRALSEYSSLSDEAYSRGLGIIEGTLGELDRKNSNFRIKKWRSLMDQTAKIFVIHGHDVQVKHELQLLLSRSGLEGIVLHERPDKGRSIIDKLIEESAAIEYAIAIMTPDDIMEGGVVRSRQNVILEIGYFMGKLGKSRLRLLRVGDVEIPSNLHGILYQDIDESGAWKMKLLKELIGAGFKIDIDRVLSEL